MGKNSSSCKTTAAIWVKPCAAPKHSNGDVQQKQIENVVLRDVVKKSQCGPPRVQNVSSWGQDEFVGPPPWVEHIRTWMTVCSLISNRSTFLIFVIEVRAQLSCGLKDISVWPQTPETVWGFLTRTAHQEYHPPAPPSVGCTVRY